VNIALAVFYAGVISVDRFAAFNVMLSRPIVISMIMGLLFGNGMECFYVGIIFEAIGLVDVPFGTRVPKEDSFGAFAGCSLLYFLPHAHEPNYVLLFLLILLMMYPVTLSLHITRAFNKALYVRQQKSGRIYPLRLLVTGFCFSYMRGVVFYTLGTFLVYHIYTFLHGSRNTEMNFYIFSLMLFAFLSGYVLRFLSAKSYLKYAFFMLGLLIGWVIL
jgi:PTS system mannose-specific IIC component